MKRRSRPVFTVLDHKFVPRVTDTSAPFSDDCTHARLSGRTIWRTSKFSKPFFSYISLGRLLEKLPKLTVRSATYDPWASDYKGAPNRGRKATLFSQSQNEDKEREIDVRTRLAAVAYDELPAAAAGQDATVEDSSNCLNRPGSAVAAGSSAPGNNIDDVNRQQSPDALPSQPGPEGQATRVNTGLQATPPLHDRDIGQNDSAPIKFTTWFSQILPDLPGSTAQLRNSLPLWLVLSPPGKPDKRRLMTVHDFFKHAEAESRAFFKELDSDGDGKVTVDDVKRALRERNLPASRARDLICAARGGRWWSQSIGWEEFQSVVEEREPAILRAYTAMPVDAQGQLQSSAIQATLTKLGIAGTEENAKAMVRAVGGSEDGTVTYDRFRRFALLLPEKQIANLNLGRAWFEAASMMPIGKPSDMPEERSRKSANYGIVLAKAALAGGLASSVSVLTLHPVDTLKTRLQTTAGATLGSIVRSAPAVGVRGLYRGIIPAVGGSFVSHGVRTLSYELAASGLGHVLGASAELQIQGLASGVGTVFGTCIRIPCEVMKQRLQIGRYDNVVEAARSATATEGVSGLFRGTAALLGREVPFYVLGMIGYQQLKKVANGSAWGGRPRELANWQYIAIGGAAGAMASVATMPMDVLKTRIMTASAGAASPAIGTLLMTILREEGIDALYKGALPRALWVAPVGAMNFAGYELAKRALSGPGEAPQQPVTSQIERRS